MDINEAITAFRNAAIEKSVCQVSHDAALHKIMAKAFATLKDHGEAGRAAFRSLLSDDSNEVVCWVAAQLLCECGIPEAMNALQRIAAGDDLLALSAEMTLKEHKKGRLGSPFGRYGI
jgi:hypothetical protein